MISLSQQHLAEIQAHGHEAYPEECCGAMLGKLEVKNKKITQQILRIENNWNGDEKTSDHTNRHRRFAVTAEDYQELEKKAKDLNLALLGFYHTHPDHPAEPSQTDLSYAWPFFSYIILSVEKRKATDIFSYELDIDKNKLSKEEIQIY